MFLPIHNIHTLSHVSRNETWLLCNSGRHKLNIISSKHGTILTVGFENIIVGREHSYKSSGFLPAFHRNVFFGVSGFRFITTVLTCEQGHMYQKIHFLTPVLTYKVISTFIVIGSFQFDNLTDQSSRKGGRIQIIQGQLQAPPSLTRPLAFDHTPFKSKSRNNPYGEPVCRLLNWEIEFGKQHLCMGSKMFFTLGQKHFLLPSSTQHVSLLAKLVKMCFHNNLLIRDNITIA